MKKKYILVTGVAGMIGAEMTEWIIKNQPEYGVVGIDNLFGGYIENIPKGCDFYCRDLAKDSIADIFNDYEFEYVYHFAAYAAEGLSPFIRKFNYSNNIVSTCNVINECIKHDVKRLVYTSSMSVYGHGTFGNDLLDEETPRCPIDPYGVSKFACEMDIKIANEQHGLDYCIIRPHNVFGRHQNIWDMYRNVLGIWMLKALKNEPMLIYGDGKQMRAFSYVSNMLPCLWKAATEPQCSKETINLGDKKSYTLNDAAEAVASVTGWRSIKHVEARHEAKYSIPTFEKSEKLLGYTDTTSFEEGLKIMWEWAKEQPERKQFKWENYELDKGIYGYWK